MRGEARIYKPGSPLPTLILSETEEDNFWIRRSTIDQTIGDRAPTGYHRITRSWRGYSFKVNAHATGYKWQLLSQLVALSSEDYNDGNDGHLILEDHLNPVPAALVGLNGRTILPSSTQATGLGFNQSLCAFKVIIRLPDEHEQILVIEKRYTLSFDLEELP